MKKGELRTPSFIFEGDFVDNAMQGTGKIQYSNGDAYEGEFKNNKKWGHGTHLKYRHLCF